MGGTATKKGWPTSKPPLGQANVPPSQTRLLSGLPLRPVQDARTAKARVLLLLQPGDGLQGGQGAGEHRGRGRMIEAIWLAYLCQRQMSKWDRARPEGASRRLDRLVQAPWRAGLTWTSVGGSANRSGSPQEADLPAALAVRHRLCSGGKRACVVRVESPSACT